MHDPEKSDSGRVAAKPTNKAGRPAAEPVEPRPGTKGNADQQSTHRTQSRVRVTRALDRVRQGPTCALTSNTRDRSRMPKSGLSGSVRSAQQWASLPRYAEQVSKRTMCRPTRQRYRGRLSRLGEMSEDGTQPLHRGTGGSTYTRKVRATREAPKRG